MGDNILDQKAKFHLIERIVPFGEPFKGKCLLCGYISDNPEDNYVECPNPKGIILRDAIKLAIYNV